MACKCDLCGKETVQIGKEIFYCKDCDKIVTPDSREKNKLKEITS